MIRIKEEKYEEFKQNIEKLNFKEKEEWVWNEKLKKGEYMPSGRYISKNSNLIVFKNRRVTTLGHNLKYSESLYKDLLNLDRLGYIEIVEEV